MLFQPAKPSAELDDFDPFASKSSPKSDKKLDLNDLGKGPDASHNIDDLISSDLVAPTKRDDDVFSDKSSGEYLSSCMLTDQGDTPH